MIKANSSSGRADIASAVPPRKWRSFALRISGSALALSLLFFLLPRKQLIQALSGFSTGIWLAGVSVYLCLHLIGVAKWRILINAAGAGFSFAQAARCYYYGLFGNTFLPSVVGGDILRAGLAMKMSSAKSAVLMGSILDRTVDSIGLAMVAGIGALLVPLALDQNSRSIFWGFAALIVIAGTVMVAFLLVLPARRFAFHMRRKMVKLRQAVRSLLKRPGKVFIALIAAMVLQTSQVVLNVWLGRLALIQNATFLMWLFVWPLAKLAALAPLTQGGIGLREAAQGVLFVPFGVSIEKAVAAGLIFQTIVIGGNLLAGALATLIGSLPPPSAAAGFKADASTTGKPHQAGILGAFICGGVFFFGANTLAIAYGTGAAGAEWVEWMTRIPGFGVSFAGSCIGFAYGMGFGYVLGYLTHKLNGVCRERS